MARAKGIKPMAQNKKAFHDYFVEERLECGMELKGTEVKSMRQGRMNLKESFAIVKDGEVLVCGMHISPYEQGNIFNTDPLRQKKLLLHKGAADVKIVSLLDKPDRRVIEINADYVGFEIPNEFVVGYGLDYNQKYRNLPYIGVLKPSVYE